MSQVEPSSEKYLVSESVLRENNNNNNVDSRKNSSSTVSAAAISRNKSITTINSGSGIDYGVVNVAPTPPPLPANGNGNQQQQLLTHFPSNHGTFTSGNHGTFRHQAHPDFGEMSENNPVRRKSILLNGTMPKMSNDINIITAPNLMEKPILPGIYK